MINRNRLLLVLVIMLGCSNYLSAQTRLKGKKWKQEVDKYQELVYYLPRHEFVFDVSFLLQEHRPGPFTLYAESMLGIRDAIRTSQHEYRLTDLKFHSLVLPDDEARFVLKPRNDRKNANCLALNPHQLLLYYGPCCGMPDDVTAPVQADPFIGVREPVYSTYRYHVIEGREKPAINPRRVVSDTGSALVEVRPVVQETPADQRQAREIADRIQELQASRIKLLSGYQEIQYSREALMYMDQQLKEVQNAYIRLFTGDTVFSHEYIRVNYAPDKDREGEWVPLFRLDPMRGILPVTAVTGDFCRVRWTSASLEKEETVDSLVSIDTTVLPELDWLRYRLPRLIRIEVMLGSKLVFSQTMPASQLGELQAIPIDGLTIRLDAETGVPVQSLMRKP